MPVPQLSCQQPIVVPLLLLFLLSPVSTLTKRYRETAIISPPLAHQFLGKRSFPPTMGEVLRANPLLASLAMFREGRDAGLLLDEQVVDITSAALGVPKHSPTLPPLVPEKRKQRRIMGSTRRRRKYHNRAHQHNFLDPNPAVAAAYASMAATNFSSAAGQMDNFDPIYQIFNATLFDTAKAERRGDPLTEQQRWKTALPWGVRREEQQQQTGDGGGRESSAADEGGSSTTTTTTTMGTTESLPLAVGREGKFHEDEKREDAKEQQEEEGAPPFEVTDSLVGALSKATTAPGRETTETLMGQERQFPMGELRQSTKYPWERERGEQSPLLTAASPGLTVASSSSSPSSSLPPLLPLSPFPPPAVMPGASFYVDQHVSHGPFGREPDAAPSLVYDPNVLQSRYGYSGMLPQMMPDGQMVRFGELPPKKAAGVQTLSSAAPPLIADPRILPAAAVFFIPVPPRLSMARAVPARVYAARQRGAARRKWQKLGFWPEKSKEKWRDGMGGEGEESAVTTTQRPATTTERRPRGEKMVPQAGNHLRWLPAGMAGGGGPVRLEPTDERGERLELVSFEELGNATKWPCQVDPAELLLADSPPDLGRPLSQCFRRVRQCVLHWAAPLERRIGLAKADCVRLCARHPRCVSLTFSRPGSICDIFNVHNGTGPARLLHHRDFDYLEAAAGLKQCWATFAAEERRPPEGEGPPVLPGTLVLVDSSDHSSEERDEEESRREAEAATATTVPTTQTTTSTPGIASSMSQRESCASERDIVVFKSQGYRLAAPAASGVRRRQNVGESPPKVGPGAEAMQRTEVAQQSSETECIFSCLVNLAQGQFPFECLAATFDTVQALCVLHGLGSAADGSVHLVPDPSFSHYEKGCVQEDIVDLCRGFPVVRYPQKTLLGFALGSRQASSLIGCLELCWLHNAMLLANGTKGEERCRSVVYFYEEADLRYTESAARTIAEAKNEPIVLMKESSGGHNCMLNSESRDTAPAFFVDENEALVDYASFDGCYELEEEERQTDGLGTGLQEVTEAERTRVHGIARERAVHKEKARGKWLKLTTERRRKEDAFRATKDTRERLVLDSEQQHSATIPRATVPPSVSAELAVRTAEEVGHAKRGSRTRTGSQKRVAGQTSRDRRAIRERFICTQ